MRIYRSFATFTIRHTFTRPISFQAQNSPFPTDPFHHSLLAPTGLPRRTLTYWTGLIPFNGCFGRTHSDDDNSNTNSSSVRPSTLERLKDGNIHMYFFSRSGYRPLINPPPSLGNLLLDITLFNFIPVSFSFFVNFRVRVRVRVSYRVRTRV